MLDHFGFLAPFYDRLIAPPDPTRLQTHVGLPAAGRIARCRWGNGQGVGQLRPFVDNLFISDVSQKMLHQAQEKGLCCPAAAEVEKLPFADDSFERVLVVDALHHFENQRLLSLNLSRILKPGGRLVIEEPDLNSFCGQNDRRGRKGGVDAQSLLLSG